MNKRKSVKFLSMLLAVLMLLGSFSTAVFADNEEAVTEDAAVTDAAADGDATDEEAAGEGEEDMTVDEAETIAATYLTSPYSTPEEKLASMTDEEGDAWFTAGDYELYCDAFTGEIGLRNTKTGQILLSNPIDLRNANSDSVRYELMSQLIINYKDLTQNDENATYTSFEWSTKFGQITAKKIKYGIRVEYSIGEEETRYLVPRIIEKSRFEEQIWTVAESAGITNYELNKLLTFYTLQDPDAEGVTAAARAEMNTKYPITEKMAVYVFDTEATRNDLKTIEKYIKKYCPKYTYAKMEEDHQYVNYVATEEAPPLFKMALEYYLTEDGMNVTLPANGVRFDEDKYLLNYIKILPYFGAANSINSDGYIFVPDGSGALLDYAKLADEKVEEGITGQVYGIDNAYHDIVTTKLETMRLPVFGLADFYKGTGLEEETDEALTGEGTETDETSGEAADETADEVTDAAVDETVETEAADTADEAVEGEAAEDEALSEGEDAAEGEDGEATEEEPEEVVVTQPENRGFFAIIESGDALATIKTSHGGSRHVYNSVYAEYKLRPSDSYNLADAISVGDDTVWTITSDRKYTGSYSMRIIMLSDEEKATAAGLSEEEYYSVDYIGMANAYQDYLVANGTLTPLEKTGDDIPLFIESFGTIDTDSTFLSIPVTVTEALTSFDNLKTMHKELSAQGVKNVNFRLTGFANGGMISSVPTEVNFQDEVGGDDGYTEFVKYADENNIKVYPEFDLSYAAKDEWFDGYSHSSDATRTIDNRYSQKRAYYSSLQQTVTTGLVCISPAAFGEFYGNINEDLTELGKSGISLGTLGTDLNSDFDEDDTYNREDSKELVQDLLKSADEDFESVMVDGGNAFTWQYADTILNMSLDSSRHANASRSIPFIGMVLHGYKVYAGKPTNMSSDMDYETLKIIENGATPYFTLSYDNTELLKEDKTLSKYYSVRYDIWKEDLIDTYNEINSVLKNVQFSTIENHEFLSGIRVLEENETAEHVVDDGTIVRVTYSNGTAFILNYNRFAVEVEGNVIDPLGYIVMN